LFTIEITRHLKVPHFTVKYAGPQLVAREVRAVPVFREGALDDNIKIITGVSNRLLRLNKIVLACFKHT
jgi:hypothetical protein